MSGMRTIRVTGKGQIRVKPDMTRITLTVEGVFPDYGEAHFRSSIDTEELRALFGGFGFEPSDLKTLNFSMDTEYRNYKVGNEYRQRFEGYKFVHRMKIEFESDNARLGRILFALAHSPVKPEFRLSYTVKDQEAAKNELLGRAVKDAMDKAAVLARAAGVTLGDIQSVDYSWGRIEFEVHPTDDLLMEAAPMTMSADSYDLDIEPDDIEVTDTVTVLWQFS